jgi:RNA polymerase sigma factor (sigma-70 family)
MTPTPSGREERELRSRTPMSLLLRLPNGTDDDWCLFWGIYGPMVLRLAGRRGLCREDAEDILAVVMRSLMEKFKAGFKVDHGKGLFRSLVATITHRAISAHHKRTRQTPGSLEMAGEPVADDPLPDEELARLERLARLRLCLERLRNDRRIRRRDVVAFERYALAGEPAARVAKDLEITPARVHGIKHQMLKRMQKLMLELEFELGEV